MSFDLVQIVLFFFLSFFIWAWDFFRFLIDRLILFYFYLLLWFGKLVVGSSVIFNMGNFYAHISGLTTPVVVNNNP